MTLAPTKPDIQLENWPVAPEKEKSPAYRILEWAHDYIKMPRHWTKGKYYGNKGAVCLMGGLENAQMALELHNLSRIKAITILTATIGKEIIAFNDSSRTRKKDVLEALQKAMKRA